MVESYRPGALAALGLGYDVMSEINPRLIYCSISAFGQDGPRGRQTAYDHVIQATSGLMATTGTEDVNPIKFGSPAVDYATGTMGAFALASALFQRERTGRGQRIDLAMLDVAMILMSSHLTGHLRDGSEPKPSGNRHLHATNSCYPAKEGLVMLGASNLRQQRRLWQALERPDMVKRDNEERERDRDREAAILTDILQTRPPTNGRYSFRRIMSRRRVYVAWRTPFAIRNLPPAASLTIMDRRPGSKAASLYPSPPSNSPMAGRASRRRRPSWAPTPTRFSPNMVTTRTKSRRFATRG